MDTDNLKLEPRRPTSAVEKNQGIVKQIELDVLLDQPRGSLTRILLDTVPVAAGIALDGKIVYVNAACARLWRLDDPAGLIGKTLFDLNAPESQADLMKLWHGRREGSDPWTYELVAIRDDGSRFPYRSTSVSLETSRGKATFAFIEELAE